jgi:3-oxoacyl-[acyl-carrier-protein] synthase II
MAEMKICITGIGLTTPLGQDVPENWRNLVEMKTGIGYYPEDSDLKNFQYIGKIETVELPEPIPPKLLSQMRFLNRGSLLGFVSAHEAVSRSGINIQDIPPGRRGLYIASGDLTKVGYDFLFPATQEATEGRWQEIDFEKLNLAALDKINPFFLLESISNNLFSFLSAFFDCKGPNTSLASFSPTGMHALELAYRGLQHRKADMALVVGCGNWITEIPLYEIDGLGMLSRCEYGAQSFRPFDRRRDGFIPGEGGAAVLLETVDAARTRGAEILATIEGLGNSIDFSPDHRMIVPANVAERSIRLAMDDSGCDVKDLALINPHGSGTQKGDRSELSSLMDILDNHRSQVPICGMKPYTGHLGAASDIAEIIFGILAVKDRMVPATPNFKETEKDFSELNIPSDHRDCGKDHFLTVSYGLGGESAAVVIKAQ